MFLINKIISFFFIFTSVYSYANSIKEDQKDNIRLYLNSDYIQSPSQVYDQRYGLSILYTKPINTVIAYSLDLKIQPDFKKKSQNVNIFQNFYSLNAYVDTNFIWFFRYHAFAGPGIVMSHSQYQIMNTLDSRVVLSPLIGWGLAVDYAINLDFEVGWHLTMQYRMDDQKIDLGHGFGLIVNL